MPEPHSLARKTEKEIAALLTTLWAESDALGALLQEYAEHSASEHTADWHSWRDGWLARVKEAIENRQFFRTSPPQITMAEAYPREQARLRALLRSYYSWWPAEASAAISIEAILRDADQVAAAGDLAGMARAFGRMRGCE